MRLIYSLYLLTNANTKRKFLYTKIQQLDDKSSLEVKTFSGILQVLYNFQTGYTEFFIYITHKVNLKKRCVCAVSYTHLDVYKRQEQRGAEG